MQLPVELIQAIESLAQSIDLKSLKSSREQLTSDYRKGSNSRSAFRDKSQLLSYLITRMPATFAASHKVFSALQSRLPEYPIRTLVDLGSGPGSAAWAATDAFPSLSRLHLLEREPEAIEIGKRLASASSHPAWLKASWTCTSLTEPFSIPTADLAILSYVLGELELKDSIRLLDRLWKSSIPLIAILEPGTPKGYEQIIAFRTHVLQLGAQLIAPCPHALACPLSVSNWCHFPARVERTRLHRLLKEGTLGYEDEKFSYLIFAKPNLLSLPILGRVVRQPIKASGHVKMQLCASNGQLEQLVVTKSDEKYRTARHADWGSEWL
jgi:ribosomal protein RSM22 (predicted rRNA methylase)